MLTVNDFFCGCGGMGLGFIGAGYTIAGAWDFDKYAVESYRRNVGDHVQQADIREMTWRDIPAATVWAFGFPCQDLSVAGKQVGLIDGSRSGLFFEIMRLLEETTAHAPERMPLAIVAENVKGLKPYIPLLEAEYKRRGYTAHIKLFNSKYHGVAQNRERYYIVGIRDDLGGSFSFTDEQTDNIPRLSEFLDTRVAEKYYISDDRARKIIDQALERLEKLGHCHATLTPERAEKRQNGRRAKDDEEEMFTLTAQDLHGVIVEYIEPHIEVIGTLEQSGTTQEHNNRVHDPDGLSPTLTAVAGGTHHIKIFDYARYRVRRLTPTEYGRLQAFPVDDGWVQVVSDSQAYKQFGNAVTVTVARSVAKSLSDFIYDALRPALPEGFDPVEQLEELLNLVKKLHGIFVDDLKIECNILAIEYAISRLKEAV